MKVCKSIVVSFVLLVYVSGCMTIFSQRTHSLDKLKDLSQVDRIEVEVLKKDEQGRWTRDFTNSIIDPQHVASITKTFSKFSDKWNDGYFTTLPGRLTVEFYKGEELVIPIIIAAYPNTKGRITYVLSRPAGPARLIEEIEFKELMKLLELNEELAYFDDMEFSVDAP